MVTYRRETNQWRDMHPWQRAMMLRDDADIALTACEMQHRRVVDYREPLPGDGPKSVVLRGRVDVDFRENLEAVNANRAAKGLPPIDPANAIDAKRYGFGAQS